MNNNRPSFWNSIPPVVKNLLIINFILWLATFVGKRFGLELSDYLGMHYWGASKFGIYQMITYMFMHADFSHLFFNMFALFMFGSLLENTWGSKKFLLYYMVTGIGAGIIQQVVMSIELHSVVSAFNNAMTSISSGSSIEPYKEVIGRYFRVSNWEAMSVAHLLQMKTELLNVFTTVGASGAIFGLLLAYGMMFPNSSIYIMFIPIPIKAKWFVIVYGLLEIYLGFANRAGDSVAHFAHVGGMLFGIILILYWKKKGRLYN